MTLDPANRNTLWASLLVDEWQRAGLRAVVLAPGSRSTPLAVAFSRSPLPHYVVPDERAAGFFALGMAKAWRAPVAVLTTSGTATANLHPAVLEAHHSHIPLLVLTADRPAELQDSGANQTTDQHRLYGTAVRWFHALAPPEAHPPARLLRYVRSVADRSLAYASGWGGPPGPVHLNVPFRKPLEPQPRPADRAAEALAAAPEVARGRDRGPWTRLVRPGPAAPPRDALRAALAEVQAARRGLVVAGPDACPTPAAAQALVRLAARWGYPVLADPLSGVRFGPWVAQGMVLGGVSRALAQGWRPPEPPEVVVHFGAAPVGFGPLRYLADLPASTTVLTVTAHGQWNDPHFRTAWHFWAAPEQWLYAAEQAGPLPEGSSPTPWTHAWQHAEAQAWPARLTPTDEGPLSGLLAQHAPAGAWLVASNSLPIRHLDEWARPRSAPLRVAANRGLSGIDGVLATATGLALAAQRPTVLLIGDVALYHDLNSLALAPRFQVPLAVVVLNNNGGRIFQRLPIAAYEPPFTQAFRAPLNARFAAPAQGFGWTYQAYDLAAADLPQALAAMWQVKRPTLLEIRIPW